MKVLIITKSFVREVADFMRYLAGAAPTVRIHVIMPSTTPIPPQSQAVLLRRLYWTKHIRATWFSPRLLWDIQDYRPDIVHVFEEFSSIMAFQAVFFKQIGQRACKCLVYSAENIPGNIHPIFRLPARYVMRHTDLACVCSAGVIPVMRHEGYPNAIEVFPLGVDTSLFHKFPNPQLRHQLGLDGKFVIGYIGRLLAMKGVMLIIDALRGLPDHVHALFVGSGPEQFALQHAAATYQLAHRVHVAGAVPYAQLPQYINCMDLGVVPSRTTLRWKEQFGRALVELMSCEVPVIGTNSGSIPEVLGDVGYVFDEHEGAGLTARILELMASEDKRRDAGQRGRARVLQHYSTDVMGARLLALYRMLL